MTVSQEELFEHLRRAAGEIQTLQKQKDDALGRLKEPIAVVGTGCRFPGGIKDLASFWKLLEEGREAVGPIAPSRFDLEEHFDARLGVPGKCYVKTASTLADIASFDADFFGISPREAMWIDPQHRVLLECAWEALEDAGTPPSTLREKRVGVFVGIGPCDYVLRAHDVPKESIGAYTSTGTAMSFSAGRVSYVLGLQGPAVSIDTACSSSLVSLHLACQALRNRECELALAAGVQLMVSPEGFVVLSQLRALSPDGRCKTFSASADGYGRGEGCGVVALRRLSDAQRDGNRILALICGSAVNHDGPSSGLTTPNGPAQEAVIRQALNVAGWIPADVDYVECHGTGTALGDPIEVTALGRVYGKERKTPLLIGTAKTNIGHTEAASGIAGVLKSIASLQHRAVPKSLHAEHPNTFIDWQASNVAVSKTLSVWPQGKKPRRVGVSSFGLSGTNAHVVLEEAPGVVEAPEVGAKGFEVGVVSGKTEGALFENAGKLLEQLKGGAFSLRDVAYSLATTRTHHEERAGVVAQTAEAFLKGLEGLAKGETWGGVVRGSAVGAPKRVAWLLTGQGAQRLGMGKGLYGKWPEFRAAFDEACAAFEGQLPKGLKSVVWADEGSADAKQLDETQYTQAALFALEWALCAQWKALGLRPQWLVGHSIGEVVAAAVAGVFSLGDAAKLVGARGRLMQALPGGGVMVSVEATEEEVAAALKGLEEKASVAAVNGPTSVVVAGEAQAVGQVVEGFKARGGRTKGLKVSHAFHSPLMQPMLKEFEAVAKTVDYRAPTLPLVSNVTGKLSGKEVETAAYWVRHVREAVRFGDGLKTVSGAGANVFLEVGPKATLLGLVNEAEATRIATLRQEVTEEESFMQAVGALHCAGQTVAWKGLFPEGGKKVGLPTYAWQRQRYWVDAKATVRSGEDTGHPLLGYRVPAAGHEATYENVVSTQTQPWLLGHRVGGHVVMPGAALADMVRAAGEEDMGGVAVEVRNLTFEAPLVLPEKGGQRLQVVLRKQGGQTEASVYSQKEGAGAQEAWVLHATGSVAGQEGGPAEEDVEAMKGRCSEDVSLEETYRGYAASGLEYGESFRGLKWLKAGPGEAYGELALPEGLKAEGYGMHPALLDAGFQALAGVLKGEGKQPYLPFEMGRVRVHVGNVEAGLVHVSNVSGEGSEVVGCDVRVLDVQGRVLVEVEGFTVRRTDVRALGSVAAQTEGKFFRLEWQEAAAPEGEAQTTWLVVGKGEKAQALAQGLSTRVVEAAAVAASPEAQVVWLAEGSDAVALAQEGLALTQALTKREKAARLWWVTQGGVAARGEVAQAAQAAVWGLGRTVLQEKPEWQGVLVDVEEGHEVAPVLLREAAATDGEAQVALRDNRRWVARLRRAAAPEGEVKEKYPGEATVWVSGGLGALGLLVAKEFARQGVKHLLLTGRRGLETPGAHEAVKALEALGAAVTVAAADATDKKALKEALAGLPAKWPLRGVVHAVGVLDDGLLGQQTPKRFARVMAPKVEGALALRELTRGESLEFFVLFSSMAGVLGNAGQGAYAAANAALDALATQWKHEGLNAISMAWGPWAEVGMASALDKALQARLSAQGLVSLSPNDGMALFREALRRGQPNLTLASLDFKALQKAFGEDVPTLFQGLVRNVARDHNSQQGPWAQELSALSPEARHVTLQRRVREEIARILSVANADTVSPQRPFKELGLDSLMAIELRNALVKKVGCDLPSTTAFDHPTVEALTGFLLQTMEQGRISVGARKFTSRTEPFEEEVQRLQQRVFQDFGRGLPSTYATWTDSRPVLLTGATGFLGSYLLRNFLQHTERNLVCVVRQDQANQTDARLWAALDRTGNLPHEWEQRIRCVDGDLTRPRLGLSQGIFDSLAEQCGVIVHCGAVVHHARPYEQLRAANVDSLHALIGLATQAVLKPIMFVSSTNAYSTHFGAATHGKVVYLEDELPTPHKVNGYGVSKFFAEKTLAAASSLGLSTRTVRPSLVFGTAQRGIDADYDPLLMLTIRAMVRTRTFAEGILRLPSIGVEDTARLIRKFSTTDAVPWLRSANLTTTPVTGEDIARVALRQGIALRAVPMAEFSMLAQKADPRFALYEADVRSDSQAQHVYSTDNLKAACEALGEPVPEPISDDILGRAIREASASLL